jgi:hypothetical protein
MIPRITFWCVPIERRDSSYGVAIGYRLHVRFTSGARLFSSPQRLHWLWSQPGFLSVKYIRVFSLEVKLPGREAGSSPPSSVEKNDGAVLPFLNMS